MVATSNKTELLPKFLLPSYRTSQFDRQVYGNLANNSAAFCPIVRTRSATTRS